MKKILLFISLLLLLTSCKNNLAPSNPPSVAVSEMFSAEDRETGWSESDAVKVDLSQGSVNITNSGIYLLRGTLENGQVNVNAPSEAVIRLIFDGVNISCNGKAAVCIMQADKVYITLADNSENFLTVTGDFAEGDSADSALYSKCDLTLNGYGRLTVNNSYSHGIEAKDDLFITGGSYTVASLGHGFQANDSIRILNGDFKITSSKDAFHAENEEDSEKGFVYIADGSFDITSDLDGISASSYMTIESGTYNITAGGGSTAQAIRNPSGEMERPEGMERPERMEFPNGIQIPEGFEMPEGTDLPNDMQRSDGAQMGGGRGQGGGQMRPDNKWNNDQGISSSEESAKGIKGGSVLSINSGIYNIDSADDCIHSNADVKINGGEFILSTDDDAFHADGNLSFTDGNIKVTHSYEALEGESVDISGGVFVTASSDDGINAAGGADSSGFGRRGDSFGSSNSYINISGGTLLIDADGDGIDSNGALTVSGGELTVLGPLSSGDAPVDWQTSGEITGGTVVAVGSSTMASNFDSASQGSIYLALDSYIEKGKILKVADANGETILEKIIDKEYNCLLVSSPKLEENGSYKVFADSEEHSITLDGFAYSKGSFGGFGKWQGDRRKDY